MQGLAQVLQVEVRPRGLADQRHLAELHQRASPALLPVEGVAMDSAHAGVTCELNEGQTLLVLIECHAGWKPAARLDQ